MVCAAWSSDCDATNLRTMTGMPESFNCIDSDHRNDGNVAYGNCIVVTIAACAGPIKVLPNVACIKANNMPHINALRAGFGHRRTSRFLCLPIMVVLRSYADDGGEYRLPKARANRQWVQ